MDKLKAIRFFLLVAEHGNIAKAAQITDTSAPTISKAIARLEKDLQCQLFIRSTRHFSITPEGKQYLETARGIVDTLQRGEDALRSQKEEIAGTISINLPVSYGRLYITPMLQSFCEKHPDVDLQIQYNDAYVDIIEQGIDLTVRSGTVQNSRLICQKLSPLTMMTCASKSYVAKHGIPKSFEDVQRHHWIHFRYRQTGNLQPLIWESNQGTMDMYPPRRFIVDDGEAMAELCAMGLGLTQTPHFIARNWLQSGEIVAVKPAITLPKFGIYLLYPRRDLIPARTLAVLEHTKASLRAQNETIHGTWADDLPLYSGAD